jgi:hypothetical protein
VSCDPESVGCLGPRLEVVFLHHNAFLTPILDMCLHLNHPAYRSDWGEGDSDSTVEGEGSGGDGAVVVAEHGGRAGGARRR